MTAVKFDNSGQYLAAGGADARIYGVKQDWQLLSTLSDLPQKVCKAVSCHDVCLPHLLPMFNATAGSVACSLLSFGQPSMSPGFCVKLTPTDVLFCFLLSESPLLSFVIAEAACCVLQGSQSVLSCTWNKPATKLFVGSVDHNLRVFGPPSS